VKQIGHADHGSIIAPQHEQNEAPAERLEEAAAAVVGLGRRPAECRAAAAVVQHGVTANDLNRLRPGHWNKTRR
jgi:hypothetical protein